MDISVVIPLLDENGSLKELHGWIATVMQSNHLSYEIIFIDDGSKDSTSTILMNFEKDFDNPVDFEANEEKGIGAPTLVFYPKTQTKTKDVSNSISEAIFIFFGAFS